MRKIHRIIAGHKVNATAMRVIGKRSSEVAAHQGSSVVSFVPLFHVTLGKFSRLLWKTAPWRGFLRVTEETRPRLLVASNSQLVLPLLQRNEREWSASISNHIAGEGKGRGQDVKSVPLHPTSKSSLRMRMAQRETCCK